MNGFFASLFELLPTYGPGLLFVLAILETCFVTGLVVPSGLATSAATVLALQGQLAFPVVLLAAMGGGAVGDSIGFWIGRRWGRQLLRPGTPWMKAAGDRRGTAEEMFLRHPLFSVSGARLVSFVRTLMPVSAGMSGLPYRRYLVYDLIGVLGWGALYVLIGLLGQESWEAATGVVGVGGTAVFAGVTLVVWRYLRRRRRKRRERGPRSRGPTKRESDDTPQEAH